MNPVSVAGSPLLKLEDLLLLDSFLDIFYNHVSVLTVHCRTSLLCEARGLFLEIPVTQYGPEAKFF